jgi:crotonobetainyl-CoA:carnitine CoA-transferase CaiB-like acyl-CoA transferase
LNDAGLMASHITTWRDVVESELFLRRGLRVRAEQNAREMDVVRTPALYSEFDTTLERYIPAANEDGWMLGAMDNEVASVAGEQSMKEMR